MRLFSRGGHDWTSRYPWIVETAREIRKTQFILDGEAVVLGVDGISDFNALHSRKHDHEVQLYLFIALHGEANEFLEEASIENAKDLLEDIEMNPEPPHAPGFAKNPPVPD